MGCYSLYVVVTASMWVVTALMWAVTASIWAVAASMWTVTGLDSAAAKLTKNEKMRKKYGGIRKILSPAGVLRTDEFDNLCRLKGLHPFE